MTTQQRRVRELTKAWFTYPRWLLIRDRREKSVGEATPIHATSEVGETDRKAVSDVVGPGVLQSTQVTFSLKYDGSRLA